MLSFNRFLLNLAQITRKRDSNLDAINCIKQHAINLFYCTTEILFIRHKLLIFTQFDLKSHDKDDLFHVTWQAF